KRCLCRTLQKKRGALARTECAIWPRHRCHVDAAAAIMGRYPLGETWDNACRLQLDGMPEKARAPRPRGPAPRGAASVRGASVCAVFTRVGLILGLTCMAPSARAHTPDFSAAEEGWQGLSECVELARRSAGPERLKVVAQVDYEALTPDDA